MSSKTESVGGVSAAVLGAEFCASKGDPRVLPGIIVFAAYYLGARLGLALTFQPHPVSVMWPPNSILLAALLLMPARAWWLVLVSAFPAHLLAELQGDVPLRMVLCWYISNCSEALLGAAAIRYFVGAP
jgi:integral membrane sensor domain MASE1